MKKEAIEKIEQLVNDRMTVEVNGLQYTAASLHPVLFEPLPETLEVHNLRGFCGFINNDIDKIIKDNPHLIVVNSPTSVDLISELYGKKQKRVTLVSAKTSEGLDEFPFGKFLSQEEFAIRFRSLFVRKDKDDFDYVLAYTSKLTGGTELQIEDDGITQRAQVKRGVTGALKDSASLKPIVKLSPYRTFREVEQPESEFLFRIKLGQDEVPMVALFEADGGAWINKATMNVVDYIQSMVGDIPVIA